MSTIEIKKGLSVNTDDIIQSIVELDADSFSYLMGRIQKAVEQKRSIPNDTREQELLRGIQKVLPKSVLRRFKQLRHKFHNEMATDREVEELQFLSDLLEQKTAERLLMLKELAVLKQLSLKDIKAKISLDDWYAEA